DWGEPARHPWAGVLARITTFEDERAVLAATKRLLIAADALTADRRGCPKNVEAATSVALLAEAKATDGLRSPEKPFRPALLAPRPPERPVVIRFLEALESYRRATADVSRAVGAPHDIDALAVEAINAAVEALSRSVVPQVTLADLRADVGRLR